MLANGSHCSEQQCTIDAGASDHGNGQDRGEAQVRKVITGNEPGREIEADRFAVRDSNRG